MSCGVDFRRGSDPVLLWLWSRPTAAALIRPLSWEPPYAVGAALEKDKKTKKKKKNLAVHGLCSCFSSSVSFSNITFFGDLLWILYVIYTEFFFFIC